MIIKEKTVFVLGAGASHPFGYPTGGELKKIICDELNSVGCSNLFSYEQDEQADYRVQIDKFKTHFKRSSENSIDLFLKKNPEFTRLGKKLIARILFPCEDEGRLFDLQNTENWCHFFWNIIDNNFENIDKHHLHFITYNYDRSLEHFLFLSLYHSYAGKKSQQECAEKLKKIDIRHVYGCLAPLPWQDPEGRAYAPEIKRMKDFDCAVENLYLIGEERSGQPARLRYSKIQEIMSEATYIYFLGFRFDEENLGVLGNDFSKAERIWGTAFGLGEFEQQKALALIRKRKIKGGGIFNYQGEFVSRVKLFSKKSLEFLREHMPLEKGTGEGIEEIPQLKGQGS